MWSLHQRRSLSTSILVLIPFAFPLLLLVAIFVLVLVDQRPLPDQPSHSPRHQDSQNVQRAAAHQ